tara:strand:+ start:762 stop:1019 length:258 start_codon:yes stop_codon:yes gene_type:complete
MVDNFCECCNKQYADRKTLLKHIQTQKHKKNELLYAPSETKNKELIIYDRQICIDRLHPVVRILKDSMYFRALNFQRIVMNNENV